MQVTRYLAGSGDFSGQGQFRGNHNAADSGSGRGVDVASDVADVGGLGRSNPQAPAGPAEQPRGRLPAVAAVLGPVRANFPKVEGAQQLLNSAVDGRHLFPGQDAAAYSRLVTQHAGGKAP